MLQLNCFPGGKKNVVTFSYDDGSANDARLVELFNRYGVKGTFHLNGKKYLDKTPEELENIRKLYEGHEIACHTMQHGFLNRMPYVSMINEIFEDRKVLEKIAGYPVTGMSYPSGGVDERAVKALEACGIVYSRTVHGADTMIELPENFLKWQPSCHHRTAMKIVPKFLEGLDSPWPKKILYIWGHSHEFRTEEDWAYMEGIVSSLAGSDKIWYATNIEIYNYAVAQRNLQISADESIVYNPSSIPVWVERDKTDIIKIEAGQTVRI